MGEEELATLEENRESLELELQKALIPPDPHDDSNVYLEIRAGTGGDEAAIFAGDLFRMYAKYAETMKWPMEILSSREGEHGGYKEIVSRVTGSGIYAKLKFESGAHRVQRVPATESQGRIHTSACTVAVLAEPDEVEEIEVNTNDLRVDTFRASGAGGQHVNKTDSAVRLTHLPSGIVVECQDERSQHKNRARAMLLLQAKLLDAEIAQRETEQAQQRKLLVGSGDRSERIRTYNYPQGRVTDHRINLTLYKLSGDSPRRSEAGYRPTGQRIPGRPARCVERVGGDAALSRQTNMTIYATFDQEALDREYSPSQLYRRPRCLPGRIRKNQARRPKTQR